jgi:DNA-binding transcriptional MerR regulator
MKWLITNEVGRMFAVTSDAVRLWERLGLIKAIRTSSGQRLFAAREVERFKIMRARKKVKVH